MYLNDCQRTAFYEGIGLDTKEFDMHVIIEVSLWLSLLVCFLQKFMKISVLRINCQYVELDSTLCTSQVSQQSSL